MWNFMMNLSTPKMAPYNPKNCVACPKGQSWELSEILNVPKLKFDTFLFSSVFLNMNWNVISNGFETYHFYWVNLYTGILNFFLLAQNNFPISFCALSSIFSSSLHSMICPNISCKIISFSMEFSIISQQLWNSLPSFPFLHNLFPKNSSFLLFLCLIQSNNNNNN